MNIAILIGHFPPGVVGGAEIQAEAWARRLADSHQVDVITRLDPAGQPAHESRDGFRVHRLKPSTVPGWRSVQDVRGISRALRELPVQPDVLLCFQTWISGFAGVLAQRHGVPALVWIRGENEYRLERSAFMKFVGPFAWSRARRILVQSEHNRSGLEAALRRHAPRIAQDVMQRTRVVPNGLELPSGPFSRGGRVLAAGRLIPKKGMDVVMDAVAGMQGLLTIAGAGPERARLVALAERLGLDAKFTGALDQQALGEHYASASCFVLAARAGEGLPNVLLEAMSWARPVIATPVGGVPDLIRDGKNGLLVAPGDPVGLRDALARIAQERGLADRLGAAARETAEEFAWSLVQPRLEAVLEEAVR